MKRSHKKLAMMAFIFVFGGSSLSAYAGESKIVGFDQNKEIVTPASKLVFTKMNPAISMAPAYGDRGKGGHGTYGKFKGDFITPVHIHTHAYHGIVISGTITNPFKGEKNPPEMVAGSYWYVPAKSEHATACVSKTPCQFYMYADRNFDFIPVK